MPTVEEIEIEINHLKEVTELKFETNAQALKIQAKEYERRLEALNGEAKRLREMQATYIGKEIYDAHHLELHKVCDELKQRLDIASGRDLTISGIVALASSILVGLIIHLILK
jgi:hypothetical protein